MSMPEEINRTIIDSISTLLFTTEPSANENLRGRKNIYYVGNVMIDSLKAALPEALALNTHESYGLEKGNYVLWTMHRPSNVDNSEKLEHIIDVMEHIAITHKVLFLAHPRTKKMMERFGVSTKYANFEKPVGYLENLSLMSNAQVVVTDSGGIQEETAFLRVPCVTLRANTERPITISCGSNVVAGSNEKSYEKIIRKVLKKKTKRIKKIRLWDGNAAKRIMKIINKEL